MNCVCKCVYIYVNVCCVNVFMCTRAYVSTYVCVLVCVHVCAFISDCEHVSANECVYVYVNVLVCVSVSIFVCMRVCTWYACVCACA